MTALRPLRILLLRIGVVALIFSLQRVLFAILNLDAMPSPPASAFIGGIRFDLSAIAWLYLPWIFSYLIIPTPQGVFRSVQKLLFHISNVVCFFLNSIDLEYFKFTLKRSTVDLFGIASGGDDLIRLIPVFLRDYWYVALAFALSMVLAEMGYRWAGRMDPKEPARPWWLWRVIVIALMVISSRGGIQYIPLGVLAAGQYAPPAYMPLVLNSPFTMMTSIGKPLLEEKHYMSQEEADRIWPVVHRYGDSALAQGRPNVVVIILESFSAAYSGRLNGTGQGYMPFLDSLMGESLAYDHAYANGRRSIDGVPAVLAGMPKMMDDAFIISAYAQQPLTTLPRLLVQKGYATSFFHGGHNGTMGFDVFAKAAGIQHYFGRREYPDAQDDDGVWGIRDRPYLQYFAEQLNAQPEPFMSCVFTLSTHHPYVLPPADAKRFAGGDLPIHPTLRYADDALREFFNSAKKMAWYPNTLFIITADHTADLERDGQASGSAFDHWVPLLYFMPSAIAPKMDHRVTQQIDILPTTLDLLGHDKPFFAIGSSSLRHERTPAAISANDATWLMIGKDAQLRSDGERVLWSAGLRNGPAPSLARLDSLHFLLKASIQQFNNHVIHHGMTLPDQ